MEKNKKGNVFKRTVAIFTLHLIQIQNHFNIIFLILLSSFHIPPTLPINVNPSDCSNANTISRASLRHKVLAIVQLVG